jgi:hypothetical protein
MLDFVSSKNSINAPQLATFKGKTVFSCPITSLEFGSDGESDPIAQNAFQKVKSAI